MLYLTQNKERGIMKNLNSFNLKSFLISSLFLIATIQIPFAQDRSGFQDDDTPDFEERPVLGFFYEHSSIEKGDVNFKYKIMQDVNGEIKSKETKLKSVSYDVPLIGVGGNMPFNNYFGLNGLVGFQSIKFDFTTPVGGNESITPALLIVQPGFEVGFPVFVDYHNQSMFKFYGYADAILGKIFLGGDSKFSNGELWGYAYGGGVRFAWNMIGISTGVRFAYEFWKLDYDGIETLSNTTTKQYDFDVDFTTYAKPFINLTISLY